MALLIFFLAFSTFHAHSGLLLQLVRGGIPCQAFWISVILTYNFSICVPCMSSSSFHLLTSSTFSFTCLSSPNVHNARVVEQRLCCACLATQGLSTLHFILGQFMFPAGCCSRPSSLLLAIALALSITQANARHAQTHMPTAVVAQSAPNWRATARAAGTRLHRQGRWGCLAFAVRPKRNLCELVAGSGVWRNGPWTGPCMS